ncbi:CrcB family protein [Weissella paramesenteroides]|uniref:Fluoride-specific ion channel n=1 Tax=Weissella paramesenteroides TaxID=1249 RepID=A0ABD4XIS0_WEIPA|nr:CrcB family protein [Weissella paramesenteroides]MDF8369186.1 CrcB family protein [Weissella paramesenteroides]MDF8371199.1 CrcB family protein [Weissella paramesenteroides]
MKKNILANSLAVAGGGFIGGVLRAIMLIIFHNNQFPWATIIVNLTGTFMSALLVILLGKVTKLSQVTANFIMVGILGAYTTYSTALADISRLSFLWVLLYLLMSIGGGVVVVLLSRAIGHKMVTSWQK